MKSQRRRKNKEVGLRTTPATGCDSERQATLGNEYRNKTSTNGQQTVQTNKQKGTRKPNRLAHTMSLTQWIMWKQKKREKESVEYHNLQSLCYTFISVTKSIIIIVSMLLPMFFFLEPNVLFKWQE